MRRRLRIKAPLQGAGRSWNERWLRRPFEVFWISLPLSTCEASAVIALASACRLTPRKLMGHLEGSGFCSQCATCLALGIAHVYQDRQQHERRC